MRLLVGDISTSTSAEFLADADYNWFIAQTSNVYIAAQLAANSLAATFTGAAASAAGGGFIEKQVGDLKIKKADAVMAAQQYHALSHKFGLMAAASVAPSAGGISISDMAEAESDTDRVRPSFVMRLMENSHAINVGTIGGSTQQ